MNPVSETIIFHHGQTFIPFKRIEPQFKFCWHMHNEFEIVLMLRGQGRRYIGNSVEEYQKPELVFIPAGISHTWESAHGSLKNEAWVIHFRHDGFGSLWNSHNEFEELNKLLNSKNALIISDPAGAEIFFKGMMKTNKVQSALSFIGLLEFISNSDQKILGEQALNNNTFTDERLTKIITWINQNYQNDFSLPAVAEMHYMSPYQLRSLFQKNLKKSILEYTNEIRISHACNALQNSSKTINDAALNCGFNNLSYFNRIFLKLTGLTPRQYRHIFGKKK